MSAIKARQVPRGVAAWVIATRAAAGPARTSGRMAAMSPSTYFVRRLASHARDPHLERLDALVVLAEHLRRRPPAHLGSAAVAEWQGEWRWVILALHVARYLLLLAALSRHCAALRSVAFDVRSLAKSQAAKIHSRHPRLSPYVDARAALWGLYLG